MRDRESGLTDAEISRVTFQEQLRRRAEEVYAALRDLILADKRLTKA